MYAAEGRDTGVLAMLVLKQGRGGHLRAYQRVLVGDVPVVPQEACFVRGTWVLEPLVKHGAQVVGGFEKVLLDDDVPSFAQLLWHFLLLLLLILVVYTRRGAV
jgi:hypothetical protein